jgi:hypothetical protein
MIYIVLFQAADYVKTARIKPVEATTQGLRRLYTYLHLAF